MIKFYYEMYPIFGASKTPDYSVEVKMAEGVTLDIVIENFRSFLAAVGYSKMAVDEYFYQEDRDLPETE